VFSGALPSIMIRLLVSLALYTGLLMAHADVIGVSPLPVGGLS